MSVLVEFVMLSVPLEGSPHKLAAWPLVGLAKISDSNKIFGIPFSNVNTTKRGPKSPHRDAGCMYFVPSGSPVTNRMHKPSLVMG